MLLCSIHTHHLNECWQILSAQMQLILCLSLLLFFPGIWQLIISASALPGWWISDTSIMLTYACFIGGLFPMCSSIRSIYVARPGFTFRVGEQTARRLLIWPCFSSQSLIKSPALFAIQARGMALLLCSAITCQFPALPDREIRPPEVEERRCDEKQAQPPL